MIFGHLPELFIILIIGLIVFGPEKLPEMAASAGKMVREVREAMDMALNPQEVEVPDDFSTYYYESLERSGEEVPVMEYETEDWETDESLDWAEGERPVSVLDEMDEEAEAEPEHLDNEASVAGAHPVERTET